MKAIFLLFLAALAGAGFYYREPLTKTILFTVTRRIAKKAVDGSCKDDLECRVAMIPVLDECVGKAVNDNRSDSFIDQEGLVGCLQRKFLSYSCKAEKRCVATVDTYFDRCWKNAYPAGTDLSDPKAGDALGRCLQDKAPLVDVK